MVRSVSEDKVYNTIEFNEFLQMMAKQQQGEINEEALIEAFRQFCFVSHMARLFHHDFSIFDKDKDGLLTVEEFSRIMLKLGENLTGSELEMMINEVDQDKDGFINYTGG